MSYKTAIDDFTATLAEEVPLCSGIVPLDVNISHLFYRNTTDGSLGCIDFSTAVSDAQLEHLIQACQPATFGVQQKDVLDESYRKAWKMDAVNFATKFNPYSTGIMKAIQLLVKPESTIRIELYKLNVYGPGSFFKSHVDTPRGDKMFGSLVVVLPTKHEGGALLLRHHGREWNLDSGGIISPQNSPQAQAAFIAFFSDVEHEVSVVKSGYRVTLTYNLYFGDENPAVPSMLPINETELKIKKSLITLLNDPTFLPDGGLLGFGLSHRYPINPQTTNLHVLGKSLKGPDAMIKRVCDSLDLDISVKVCYEDDGLFCLLDTIASDIASSTIEDGLVTYLKDYHSALLVRDDIVESDYGETQRPILWIKPLTEKYDIESPYIAYGNDASLDYAYGEICMIVDIEASDDRETYHG